VVEGGVVVGVTGWGRVWVLIKVGGVGRSEARWNRGALGLGGMREWMWVEGRGFGDVGVLVVEGQTVRGEVPGGLMINEGCRSIRNICVGRRRVSVRMEHLRR
jgi:hypothetical protein